MKQIIWLLVAILIIVHQDFWNWNESGFYFGFMPVGLAYHVGISIAAAFVWLLACVFAWPKGIDEFENEPVSKGGDV